jgi:hypothetical protein
MQVRGLTTSLDSGRRSSVSSQYYAFIRVRKQSVSKYQLSQTSITRELQCDNLVS